MSRRREWAREVLRKVRVGEPAELVAELRGPLALYSASIMPGDRLRFTPITGPVRDSGDIYLVAWRGRARLASAICRKGDLNRWFFNEREVGVRAVRALARVEVITATKGDVP